MSLSIHVRIYIIYLHAMSVALKQSRVKSDASRTPLKMELIVTSSVVLCITDLGDTVN